MFLTLFDGHVPVTAGVLLIALLVTFRRYVFFGVYRALQAWNHNPKGGYLSGNFAPVQEEVHVSELPTEGSIPAELDGYYMRTGPNPQHANPIGNYHLFDGEAMVHAIVLRDGAAKAYGNHWLRTPRFELEKQAGTNLHMRMGDMVGIRGLILHFMHNNLGMYPSTPALQGGPMGNTALLFHSSRLLALMEGSLPYQLRMFCNGVIESIGAATFGGKLRHEMTAHPKVDPATGKLHTFGYNVAKPPFVIYNEISPEGEVSEDIPIDVRGPLMMHDFAISEKYAVWIEQSVIFTPERMVKNRTNPYMADESKPGRIGLMLLSNPKAPVRWIDVEPYVCFHVANAWDEGDLTHVALCQFDDIRKVDLGTYLERDSSKMAKNDLNKYTINTATGEVTRTRLCPGVSLDFPVVAPQLVGRPARYCWCCDFDGVVGKGVAKADLFAPEGKGLVGRIAYANAEKGGEMVFAPRDPGAFARGEAAEDDGFLMGYVTDVETYKSFFVVYDAKTMDNKPIAKVALPIRVPFGFHGTYVPRSQAGA